MLGRLPCVSHDFPVQCLFWLRVGDEQHFGNTFRYIFIDLKDCRHCTETPSSHLDSATCCTG